MVKVKVNNANVYYEVSGQGHPLVLVAGFGCNHTFWKPLKEILLTRFQVLVLDNRGSGQTQYESNVFTLETLADDVMALIDTLGWVKPHVVGHSMGGAISQYLGVKYSNKLGKLILCNTAAKFGMMTSMILHNMLALQKAKVAVDLLTETFMPWVFSEEFLSDGLKVARYKKGIQEDPYPQTIEGNEGQIRALDAFDLKLLLNRIQNETLIIGNKRDLLTSETDLEFLRANIVHSVLRILPGAHATLMEQPEVSANMIMEFVKD